MLHPCFPLIRMLKPIGVRFWVLNVRCGVREKTQQVRSRLHERHGALLDDAVFGLFILTRKRPVPSPLGSTAEFIRAEQMRPAQEHHHREWFTPAGPLPSQRNQTSETVR